MAATGRGVAYALREFFRHPNDVSLTGLFRSLYGKRIIVQGLGNVGYYASKILQEEDGAKIIAIIEHDGALIDAHGLSVESVRAHVVETGGVTGYPHAKFQTNGLAALELE